MKKILISLMLFGCFVLCLVFAKRGSNVDFVHTLETKENRDKIRPSEAWQDTKILTAALEQNRILKEQIGRMSQTSRNDIDDGGHVDNAVQIDSREERDAAASDFLLKRTAHFDEVLGSSEQDLSFENNTKDRFDNTSRIKSSLEEVECTSEFCRLRVRSTNVEEADSLVNSLIDAKIVEGEGFFLPAEAIDNDLVETKIYFSRNGHSLPRSE